MSVTRNSGKQVNFVKQPRDAPLNPNSVHELWKRLFTLITQVDDGTDGAAASKSAATGKDSGAKADKQAGAKAKADSVPQQEALWHRPPETKTMVTLLRRIPMYTFVTSRATRSRPTGLAESR
jgi:hypothetical protein